MARNEDRTGFTLLSQLEHDLEWQDSQIGTGESEPFRSFNILLNSSRTYHGVVEVDLRDKKFVLVTFVQGWRRLLSRSV